MCIRDSLYISGASGVQHVATEVTYTRAIFAAAKELELTGRGLMATSANIQTLNVKNAELTESIEELRKAIKDGTAGGLVIQDNSSSINSGGGTTNNNMIDTSGSNDVNDNYQVQPVG